MKAHLKNLIARNKTDTAIQELFKIAKATDDAEVEREVLLQSAKYQAYTKAKRQGTSGQEEQQLIISRINQALLQIIGELPEDSALQQDLQIDQRGAICQKIDLYGSG